MSNIRSKTKFIARALFLISIIIVICCGFDTAQIEGNTVSGAGTLSSDPSFGVMKKNNILWLKIVKSDHELHVMNDNEVIKTYGIATGKNTGQKERVGDLRTPEGNFEVRQIQNSSCWQHDFKDGKGMIKGAYGPWFIRLKCGWKGIGIHGTHDPASIGKSVTEGCIRLKNSDLSDLKNNYITLSMKVLIVK